MTKGFNGEFKVAWTLFNQYWKVGTIIVVVTVWVLNINQDHKDQAEIKQHLIDQSTVQDDVLVRQDKILFYMKDSLTTNSDINALLAQSQGVHDDLYRRVLKLSKNEDGYIPGRMLYRRQYGPMPSTKFNQWFWQDNKAHPQEYR